MWSLIGKGESAASAAKKLVGTAKACWENEEGEYCDDITCVVVDLRDIDDADGSSQGTSSVGDSSVGDIDDLPADLPGDEDLPPSPVATSVLGLAGPGP